jgi:hypothetical protein
MNMITVIGAITNLLVAFAAVAGVVFQFWREMRKDTKKRPRK